MKFEPWQEDAMGARLKSGKIRGAARKGAATPPGRRGRRAVTVPEAREQIAQLPDERDDEIDCLRIVQGNGGRTLPVYCDDYD